MRILSDCVEFKLDFLYVSALEVVLDSSAVVTHSTPQASQNGTPVPEGLHNSSIASCFPFGVLIIPSPAVSVAAVSRAAFDAALDSSLAIVKNGAWDCIDP